MLKRRRPRYTTFEVWHANWPAWQLFQGLSTQWRVAPMGGLLGLDYTAVHAVLQIKQLPSRLFDDLRHIEQGALAAIRENTDNP